MSVCVHPDYLGHAVSEQPRVPEYVERLKSYIPGKSIATVAQEFGLAEDKIIKLASNENPLGMSPLARAAVREAVESDLNLYPDPDAALLKTTLADYYGISPEWLTIGNGSSEILELAARAFVERGDSIIFSEYSFASYKLVSQAVGARDICIPAKDFGHDLEAILDGIKIDTKLIFIANPNNPTGTFLSGPELYDFLLRVPSNIVVVLDEAYTEYLSAEERYDSIAWTQEFPNLLVARTFSKAYGLAGLRVGYSIGQPSLTNYLNRIRPVFNVSTVSQAAATASVKDSAFIAEVATLNRLGKTQLYKGFQNLGLLYLPSRANFVLLHVGDAARINRELLQRGIIVRPVQNYGLSDWLRISVGLEEQNACFLGALKEIL